MKGDVFAFVSLLWIKNYQCFSGGIIKFGKKLHTLGKRFTRLERSFTPLGNLLRTLLKIAIKVLFLVQLETLVGNSWGDCVLIGVIKVDKIDRLNNDCGNFW